MRTRSLRIYLASRFRTLPAVLALKEKLTAAGHRIVSTWHDRDAINPVPPDSPEYQATAVGSALRDKREIRDSDLLLILTNDCEATPGGLWFEMGFAHASGIAVVFYGPRINVFCHLTDGVVQVDTEEAALAAVQIEAIDLATVVRAKEETRVA